MSEPKFHSKLEDKIPLLSKLFFYFHRQKSAFLGNPWALFLSSYFFVFHKLLKFVSISAFIVLLLFPQVLKFFFFFCLCLLIIAQKTLQLSAEWLHLPCKMHYFLFERHSKVDSPLDSMTLELWLRKISCLDIILDNIIKLYVKCDQAYM